MKIGVIKDWRFPDLKRQTPGQSGCWNGIEFDFECEQKNSFDFIIVLNSPQKDIVARVPKGNTFLLSQESPINIYQWHTAAFKYFDQVFTSWPKSFGSNIINLHGALPWHINKSYDELTKLRLEGCGEKSNRVSWVTSNANHKPGHKLRMNFKEFLEAENFSFDLFGRGFNEIDDKFQGIFPYKYSIAIENYSCNDYWTEKIADCFLSWTIPVYYGATNILKYFPERSVILIDPDRPHESLDKLKAAIQNNYWENNLDALEQARELVLNKYQFFPYIESLIKQRSFSSNRKRWYYIPRNDAEGIHVNLKKEMFYKVRNWLYA